MDPGPVSRTAEVARTVDVCCEHCTVAAIAGRAGDFFLEMAPGRDRIPWYLCARCWFDGLFPNSKRTLG